MGCVKCEGGVWICTHGMAECGDLRLHRREYECKACYQVERDGDYYVRCRQGCQEVALATSSNLPSSQWVLVGSVHLEAGEYALLCLSGSGLGSCNVAVQPVGRENECECHGKGKPPED